MSYDSISGSKRKKIRRGIALHDWLPSRIKYGVQGVLQERFVGGEAYQRGVNRVSIGISRSG